MNSTNGYQTANMPVRIIAFFIDVILMAVIIVPFLFISMGKPTQEAFNDEGEPGLTDKYQFFAYSEAIILDANRMIYIKNFVKNYTAQAFVSFLVIPWIYLALFEGILGGSIGKLLTGMRVRRKDGGKINIVTATIRLIGKYISTLIFMLGYLLAFFDRKRQTLHDKIANTLVLKK